MREIYRAAPAIRMSTAAVSPSYARRYTFAMVVSSFAGKGHEERA